MANQDRRPPLQTAEDMFGRPTDVRHENAEGQPTREQQTQHRIPHHEHPDECTKHAEEEAEAEAAYGGVGEIPDGDGVRSDLGTNPLPDVYWSAYPDKKPDER
jgi:hypothetical protein